ncbi:MAG: methionine gamma-lyase family protein [Ruminococcus sp.]|jgi:cystathionine beta-lyase family protein involved in aluminum resistance|nr:methionine gamma-lyase family protein [Ruminococcus sp.]
MNDFFEISEEILKASEKAMELCSDKLKEIDDIQEYNQHKMLKAFQKAKVSESHFTASTGYGYGDRGRDSLDEVFAYVFDAEDALVRHNFVSGTHALTVALFGVLRPGDKMLSVTGTPYDTLRSAIGIEGNYPGSLIDFGIKYEEIELDDNGLVNHQAIKDKLDSTYKMVYIQRSRGYSVRPTLTVDDIESIVKTVRSVNKDVIIMLDNCYGEFVEKKQPLSVGVDLMAGSLIKNPGGGIAPTGGYIAGRKDLVEMCSYRLTTPGTGKELGATLNLNRELFLGAYHAPHATGEALKTAVFASALFSILGYDVSPGYNEKRGDIIQLIMLKTPENLEKFCVGIQHSSAVDSFVTPYPDDMPGYEDKVIMAAGAFTLGSSIELSADAPLREPYAVWMQGSLNFHSGKLGIMLAANEIMNK